MKVLHRFNQYYGYLMMFFLLLLPIGYNELRYLGISALVLFYYTINYKSSLRIGLVEMLFFTAAAFSFISAIWARNIALVWHPSFVILFSSLLFSSVVGRSYSDKLSIEKFKSIFVFVAISTLPLFLILLYMGGWSQIVMSSNDGFLWNQVYGENKNVVAGVVLLLFPHVLSSDFSKCWKPLLALPTFLIIYSSDAKGVWCAGLIGLLLFLFIKYWRLSMVKYGILSALVVSITCLTLNSDDLIAYGGVRLALIESSLKLIQDNPFLGVGSGNWYSEVYQFVSGDLFHYYYKLIRVGSHNYFLQLTSELGLFGLTLLGWPVSKILFSELSEWKLIPEDRVFLISGSMYLVLVFFYRNSVSHYSYFSKLSILFVLTLSLLRSKKIERDYFFRVSYKVFALLSLMCCIWFLYFASQNRLLSGLDGNKTLSREISVLEKAYSSTFYTNRSESYSIHYKLGDSHWRAGNIGIANYHFKKAVEQNPFDIDKLLTYGRFLLYNNDDLVYTKEIIDRTYLLDSSYSASHMLLAEYYYKIDSLSLSKTHTQNVRDSEHWSGYKQILSLLEEKIFSRTLTEQSNLLNAGEVSLLRDVDLAFEKDIENHWLSLVNRSNVLAKYEDRKQMRNDISMLNDKILEKYASYAKCLPENLMIRILTDRFAEFNQNYIENWLGKNECASGDNEKFSDYYQKASMNYLYSYIRKDDNKQLRRKVKSFKQLLDVDFGFSAECLKKSSTLTNSFSNIIK